MHKYDETLRNLQAQCARKKRLEAELTELRTQQADYTARVRALEETFQEEQADVAAPGTAEPLRALLSGHRKDGGKADEGAAGGLCRPDEVPGRRGGALRDRGGSAPVPGGAPGASGLRRAVCRAAGGKDPRRKGPPAARRAAEILRLEARLAYLDSQTRELQEAMAAGQDALATTDQILESLDSAEGWGHLGSGGRRPPYGSHEARPSR